MKKSEIEENETLTSILGLVLKLPGAIEQIQKTGFIQFGNISINFGELFKRWLITSGTKDWDKIITENEQTPKENINFEEPAIQEILSSFSPDLQEVAKQIYGQNQTTSQGQAGETAGFGQSSAVNQPNSAGFSYTK